MLKIPHLLTIIKSRFKKETKEPWIEERRKICKDCKFNTLNSTERTFKQKIYKLLSDFYTWITRAENEDLGECSICYCPLYFSTRMPESECSAKEAHGTDYWKSIYIPNKK